MAQGFINTSSADYQFMLQYAMRELKRQQIKYTQPLKAEAKFLNERRRTKEIQRVVGERLTCIRQTLKLTQEETAMMSGLHKATISNLENGKSCNFTTLVLYTDALCIPLAEILEGTGKQAFTTTH